MCLPLKSSTRNVAPPASAQHPDAPARWHAVVPRPITPRLFPRLARTARRNWLHVRSADVGSHHEKARPARLLLPFSSPCTRQYPHHRRVPAWCVVARALGLRGRGRVEEGDEGMGMRRVRWMWCGGREASPPFPPSLTFLFPTPQLQFGDDFLPPIPSSPPLPPS